MVSRREFIEYLALIAGGLALKGCVGIGWYNPYTGDSKKFKGPGWEQWTFQGSIRDGWTPGICYNVPQGTPMVAVAKGTVIEKKSLEGRPGRAGGQMVVVAHGFRQCDSPWWAPYFSYYAHVENLEVDVGNEPSRGDVIACGGYHYNQAKLMFKEGGNWVNPDNYGLDNSYMDYWNGKTNLEVSHSWDKLQKQNSLFREFYKLCTGKDISRLLFRAHAKGTLWSTVEKFRYLEYLRQKHPEYFSATKEEIDSIRKEFYANQPIILTLPFRMELRCQYHLTRNKSSRSKN